MVYLHILCDLILIFDVFEPSKINYTRGLLKTKCRLISREAQLFVGWVSGSVT
jgi:hypothetical protein